MSPNPRAFLETERCTVGRFDSSTQVWQRGRLRWCPGAFW